MLRERYLRTYLTKSEQARLVGDPLLAADLLDFLRHTVEAPSGIAGTRSDVGSIRRAHAAGPSGAGTVKAPTLVLHGDGDKIVPPTHARYHASTIRGARLELYADAGHLLLLTHRRQTSPRIKSFVAGLSSIDLRRGTAGAQIPGTRRVCEDTQGHHGTAI